MALEETQNEKAGNGEIQDAAVRGEEIQNAAADGDAGAYAKAQTEREDGRRERARLARAVGFRDCSGG